MPTSHDAAGLDATGPVGAGEAPVDGDVAGEGGLGDELAVGAGDEVAGEGVVVGVAVADADGTVTAVGDVVGVSTAGAPAPSTRSRAVGRRAGSLARQRWISPRTSTGTRSRLGSW
jgi:hypothetical protein